LNRLDYSSANCSIVGERWTLLILREAFYGIHRFEDFQKATGCARNILSDRLETLVAPGLLERVAYREEGQRQRYEYRLTKKGLELFPVLIALMQWGDRWMSNKGGPPVAVNHRRCNAPVHAEVRCAGGHGPLTARDVHVVPGKGARAINPHD
jgi:DNA-binding HxlR family transcriptional regulator